MRPHNTVVKTVKDCIKALKRRRRDAQDELKVLDEVIGFMERREKERISSPKPWKLVD